jgi:hypothetical protein
MGYKGLRKLAVNAELGGTIDLVIGESTAKAPLASRSLRPVESVSGPVRTPGGGLEA